MHSPHTRASTCDALAYTRLYMAIGLQGFWLVYMLVVAHA